MFDPALFFSWLGVIRFPGVPRSCLAEVPVRRELQSAVPSISEFPRTSAKAMAYAIHITRRAPDAQILPIALSEWCAAVQQTENVRKAEGDFGITNPKTGEIIKLRNAGGDAEAFFPAKAEWLPVFR
jgi:hypothetical protein